MGDIKEIKLRYYKRCFVAGIEIGFRDGIIQADQEIRVDNYIWGYLFALTLEEIYELSLRQYDRKNERSEKDLITTINEILFLEKTLPISAKTISSGNETSFIAGNSIHIISITASREKSINFKDVKEFGINWSQNKKKESNIEIEILLLSQFGFWRHVSNNQSKSYLNDIFCTSSQE